MKELINNRGGFKGGGGASAGAPFILTEMGMPPNFGRDSGSVQMYRKKETIKNQPLQFL